MYALLGLFGIYIHLFQGLFNPLTVGPWNETIEPVPVFPFQDERSHLFQWRYAQWRADNEMLCEIEQAGFERGLLPFVENDPALLLVPLQLGEVVDFRADRSMNRLNAVSQSLFQGDVPNERSRLFLDGFEQRTWRELGRWSVCPQVELYLYLPPDFPAERPTQLLLTGSVFASQQIEILVNDETIGVETVAGSDPTALQTALLELEAGYLRPDALNRVTLRISDPAPTRPGDLFFNPRDIGFLFYSLELRGR